MKRWGKRFLQSTRGKVVQLLRRGEASVNDLADELGLTDNAIRSHLNTLERDGLVRISGKRAGIRKPETLYALTTDADRLFPDAYNLLFVRLIERLEMRMSEDDVSAILEDMGRSLASDLVDQPARSLRGRAEQSLSVLKEIGGLAEIRETEDGFVVQGYSCPVSSAVKEHPRVCRLARALLSEILDAPVVEMCDRTAEPRCAFRVDARL